MRDTLQAIVGLCLAALGLVGACIGIHCTRGSTATGTVTIEALGPVCAVTSIGDHDALDAEQ